MRGRYARAQIRRDDSLFAEPRFRRRCEKERPRRPCASATLNNSAANQRPNVAVLPQVAYAAKRQACQCPQQDATQPRAAAQHGALRPCEGMAFCGCRRNGCGNARGVKSSRGGCKTA